MRSSEGEMEERRWRREAIGRWVRQCEVEGTFGHGDERNEGRENFLVSFFPGARNVFCHIDRMQGWMQVSCGI